MKHRTIILAFIVACFTAIPAQARYLQMMRQYGYVSTRPTAIYTVHASAPATNTPSIRPVARFQSKAQVVPQSQYADGMNLYQYVVSNPMTYVDPFGLLKIDRKSCIKCRWAGDRPYREKFRDKMMRSMRKSCDSVSTGITDPTLATCISKMCNKAKIKCIMGKCGRGGYVDWKGTVNICPDEFNKRGIYKSKRTGDTFTAGALIIHEFAHKCGWFHGQGKGVPDPGYNDEWPY